MSYARFSEHSDVYVFATFGGYVECCACAFGGSACLYSAPEVIAHMQEHVDAGHKVPVRLLDEDQYPDDDFIEEPR